MTEPSHAVFLSYASQDVEAAQKICEALCAAGIAVFFDQSELRGGDAWDQKIRHEIHDCALFIPIVSEHTQERLEGYFRREWKLAVERTHDMAEQRPFLVPVVVDSTNERDAIVPDLFRAVQWTRLPAGETRHAFVDRIQRLLSPEASKTIRAPASPMSRTVPSIMEHPPAWRRSKRALLVAVAVVISGVAAYFAIDKLWISKQATSPPTVPGTVAQAAFNPPPHSIAVLPFVNMSGDKAQEYFSDGLSEELLNDLARINELQVAARTSAFSFKGKETDIGTIAHKLNVGAVLEGSVRRSGHTVRITAQLINAVTGFHVWSQTYDRDLGDILKLQTEIAEAVAAALKVTLLGDVAVKIELGGTRNPAAFDAYLRAIKAYSTFNNTTELQAAVAAFTDAIRLDPNYALAFARRSIALGVYAAGYTKGPDIRESLNGAQADALRAIALAPDLAESHLALAYSLEAGSLNFRRAGEEYERARTLSPGTALVLAGYGRFAVLAGRPESGIAAMRRAVVLNPLDPFTRSEFGQVLYWAHRYDESIVAYQDELVLDPDDPDAYLFRGLAYYALGNFQGARSSCEVKPDDAQICLAIAYDKLGRRADAQAVLERLKALKGDDGALDYAEIYAQWGNPANALQWLEVALRMRDQWLVGLKADPLLDPVRNQPRYQAVERALKFPDLIP